MGFTSSPYDWVPLAIISLLIVLIFVVCTAEEAGPGALRTGPGGGLCTGRDREYSS